MKTISFCEQNLGCQKVLKKHWPSVPLFSDVKKLNGKVLESFNINQIDILSAGFPCQDVSIANPSGQGLKGDKSGLWSEVKRLIKEIKPKYALIENVANLRSRGLAQILKDLWEIGYCCEWHIISAASLSPHCPHVRERIWILAYPHGHRWKLHRPQWGSEKSHPPSSHSPALPPLQTQTLRVENCSKKIPILNEKRWKKLSCQIDLHWKAQPSVGGMVDGYPYGLDKYRKERIKQLGNSIVPQIAELIGRSILHFEEQFLPRKHAKR